MHVFPYASLLGTHLEAEVLDRCVGICFTLVETAKHCLVVSEESVSSTFLLLVFSVFSTLTILVGM